ncbi:hypothetical protein [Marinibactrum halimedae]|uniref:Uncharacterized protein n=1 Tax=Marinibactrum halimedae TaxID=1444977 RepID=A0AA37T4J3_9GAMM|nr:hypothetical protein [Marinibactrum halimedae]MCD9458114.1 hypothetical protein [Marinibactrum halimedae]GLS25048.1 hypothetical protein GCM10007877_07620 [Marinibactrum halimedae]
MIEYKIPEEKSTLLQYAQYLNDERSRLIIQRGILKTQEEAIHLANFYWKMVRLSNEKDQISNENSTYIMEKIMITLMAFFRSSNFEREWDEVLDSV